MAATANTHDTKNAVKQLGNRAEIAASSGPATRLPSFPPLSRLFLYNWGHGSVKRQAECLAICSHFLHSFSQFIFQQEYESQE